MSKRNKINLIIGNIAFVMSIITFVLGTAAFTPAMMLVLFTLPMSFFVAIMGAWRLPIITLYFLTTSLFAVPLASELSISVDVLLLVMGVIGAVFGGLLFYGYKRDSQHYLDSELN